MLLVSICRDMQLWRDKPQIPSPRNCMPTETCFDDVGRICTCVTWTQMYLTLQTKNVFHSKAVIILFFISLFVRAESIRPAHDTIRYAIWCTRYDTFRDTFAILTWEAEACDPGQRSEVLHSTDYNCLRSNDAQWLQQWRLPWSFQMQCVCDEFTHFIGIYWLFSVVSRVRF